MSSYSTVTSSMAAITLSQAICAHKDTEQPSPSPSTTAPACHPHPDGVAGAPMVPPITATCMGPAALHYRLRLAAMALSSQNATNKDMSNAVGTKKDDGFSFVVPKPQRLRDNNAMHQHIRNLFQSSKSE